MENEWFTFMKSITAEDDSVIADLSFIETETEYVLERVKEVIKKHVKSIADLWYKMGIPKNKRQERTDQFIQIFYDMSKDVLSNENQILDNMIQFKETKLREINELVEQLNIKKFQIPDNITLLASLNFINNKYEALSAEKEERMNKWIEHLKTKCQLSTKLGIEGEHFAPKTGIPSDDELMTLQSHVSNLVKEKKKLTSVFLSQKKIIKELMDQLEKNVDGDFEKKLILEPSEDFILSKENIKRIVEIHNELEKEAQSNLEYRKQIDKRLRTLWDRLETPQCEREAIMKKIGSAPSIIKSLEKDLEKYEKLKKDNLGVFISKIRPEIESWWEKCYIGDDEKEKYKDLMQESEMDDDLLNKHEEILDNLKSFHKNNSSLFAKIDEYKRLWDLLYELENKMNDPSRFNNRGGALLREEKERKKLHVKLPKSGKELRQLNKEFMETHGSPFCIFGVPLDAYLDQLWDEYHAAKENEKIMKKQQKKAKIDAEMNGRKMKPTQNVLVKTPVKKLMTSSCSRFSPSPAIRSTAKLQKINNCLPLSPSNIGNKIKGGSSKKALPMIGQSRMNLGNKMNNKEIVSKKRRNDTFNLEKEAEFQAELKQRKDDILNSTGLSEFQAFSN